MATQYNYLLEDDQRNAGIGSGGTGVAPGALGYLPNAGNTPPAIGSAGAGADDIAGRINELTSTDSAWMRGARAEGLKQANRRGLVNSSIGIGAAQREAIGAAAPIASQEAQQRVQRAQIAASERANLMDNFTTQMNAYQQSLSNTLANSDIPASARAAVQKSLRDQLTYGLNWMQKLYGVTVPGTT